MHLLFLIVVIVLTVWLATATIALTLFGPCEVYLFGHQPETSKQQEKESSIPKKLWPLLGFAFLIFLALLIFFLVPVIWKSLFWPFYIGSYRRRFAELRTKQQAAAPAL